MLCYAIRTKKALVWVSQKQFLLFPLYTYTEFSDYVINDLPNKNVNSANSQRVLFVCPSAASADSGIKLGRRLKVTKQTYNLLAIAAAEEHFQGISQVTALPLFNRRTFAFLLFKRKWQIRRIYLPDRHEEEKDSQTTVNKSSSCCQHSWWPN